MFAVATLSSRWLREHWQQLKDDGHLGLTLGTWDDGDAFTQVELGVQPSCSLAKAILCLDDGDLPVDIQVHVTLKPAVGPRYDAATFAAPDGTFHQASCWHFVDGIRREIDVCFADVQPELATRRAGILESTILNDKTVLFIGVGTGGAHAAIEMAKSGVGRFILVDRDRLSVGNVVRHPGGISQVGRYKVNVVRDLILEKNPDAQVTTHAVSLEYDNLDAIRKLVSEADVVVCGTDSRPSKLLVNQLCIEAGVVAVYGGAFRRAYGGQILRVDPKKSPCYQCFVAAMPDEASDVEVSTSADAEAIAYSDRPVTVEPGLSLDVLPIANMVAKLALLVLLADKQSSLNILNRDFDAPWYLWLNRPEPGTPYATWPPLSESSDEMTIHRWYGIYFDRDNECPACGNFLSAIADNYGLDLASLKELPTLPGEDS
ncbi:MAG TPA: ThiF family adenylyltransferase [Bradyrhizobium sp.]|nr:ThiF family adenylyltransferase [Bradyrhizobium sp.]